MIFNSCIIHENTNGVLCDHNLVAPPPPTLVVSNRPEDQPAQSLTLFEKCSLFSNKKAGLLVKSILTHLYLSETTIYENKEAALYVTNMPDLNYVNLKDESNGRIGELIRGFVGGPYGTLDKTDIHAILPKSQQIRRNNNSVVNSGSKCTIF